MRALMDEYFDFVAEGNFTKSQRDAELLSGMGLAGEAGEVCDLLKKHILHGKPLDKEHLTEELGDVFWYFVHTLLTFDISLSDVLEMNIKKLTERYPERHNNDS